MYNVLNTHIAFLMTFLISFSLTAKGRTIIKEYWLDLSGSSFALLQITFEKKYANNYRTNEWTLCLTTIFWRWRSDKSISHKIDD